MLPLPVVQNTKVAVVGEGEFTNCNQTSTMQGCCLIRDDFRPESGCWRSSCEFICCFFVLHQLDPAVELSFLAYLRGRCRGLPQVAVGIGDDAAVIDFVPGYQQIACTDQIIDGVDFRSAEHALSDIGYKSMAINLSDVAAMGATPASALVTLALPKKHATKIAGEVYEGILEAATRFNVAIAGGDLTTYDGPLSISVTLLGWVQTGTAWLRSGAHEGDAILVSGAVGGSILGRHLRPEPRLSLAQVLHEAVQVTSAIDISDGLSLDLDRLCASSCVGAELDIETIPIHADAIELAKTSGRTPLQHAWSDGEDFELILTMSQADADRVLAMNLAVPLTQIGSTTGRTGLWQRETGSLKRLSPQGYVHQ
jgi:thiamine-monophosphate kinase